MAILTPQPDGDHKAAVLARVAEHAALAARVGPCTRPLHFPARAGDEDHEPVTVRCRSRRAVVCPSCSALYRADAQHLLGAGLAGDQGTAGSVARVLVTLTAPSFGPVHIGARHGRLHHCHPRKGCGAWHVPGDPAVGTALDPTSYDYVGQVLFNAHAGPLWAAFTTATRRTLAAEAGLPRAEAGRLVRVVFAKVGEFQTRGVIHLHAVIRLDPVHHGPPGWASTAVLVTSVRVAARRARVTTPASPVAPARRLRWGRKLDIQPITTRPGTASVTTVAAYIAKYATKAAETAGLETGPVHCRSCDGVGAMTITAEPAVRVRLCRDCHGTGRRRDVDRGRLTEHARALVATCWRLGGQPEFSHLHLRRHAHQAGFRGHFLTKSQTWSSTFTALRAERHAYARAASPPADPAPSVASGRSGHDDRS